MIKKLLISFLFIIGVITVFFIINKHNEENKLKNKNDSVEIETINIVEDIYPIAEFKERIIKKSFGDLINPKNSPIQPERFTGYHTGVDVEYGDIKEDIPVMAVCDGEIISKGWVSGYGGVIVLKCQINNIDYYVVYGHLSTNSIINKRKVIKGEKLAFLGSGFSQETDYERKHLHFGINQNSPDIKGYVQNKNELKKWVNPLTTDLFY